MPHIKEPRIHIPKRFARTKRLLAVPKDQFEAFLRYKYEEAEVLDMIQEAEEEYRVGTTTQITLAAQLRSL